jgi:uncharacterized protein (DUF2235 family)
VLPQAPDGVHQIVIYHEGVGTGQGMDKITGGAFGHGMEDNIRSLYRSVVYNYQAGDELFFFGFSRGAFTVRSLAGFMNFLGLVEKDDDYYVPDLYACYEAGQGPGSPQWAHANRKVQGTRPCPPIKMMGVWDTVGALGAPGAIGQLINPNKYRYHDVGLVPALQNAFQALAIDERRKPFAPSVWDRPEGWSGNLLQAWFPGVHCNVGGGYTPDGLANGALHWMIGEAAHLGLAFDTRYLAPFEPHANSFLADSMDLKYKLMGALERPIGKSRRGEEVVHRSVLDRMADPECRYAPANAKEFLSGPGLGVAETKSVGD